MSAPEPMAHHVLTPWTLGADDGTEPGGAFNPARCYWELWRALQRVASPRVLVDSDLLDPRVPPDWLADLLGLIVETPRLTWLLWTRQPEAWSERLGDLFAGTTDPPENVWLGLRASTQAEADAGIPELLRIPASLRWLWLDSLVSP